MVKSKNIKKIREEVRFEDDLGKLSFEL